MNTRKIAITSIIIFFTAFFTGCDDPTSNTDRDKNTDFVIFQNSEKGTTELQINNLVDANVLEKSQIKFSYENKISGFSATLSQSQIDLLNSEKYEGSIIIPGEFILVFNNPFDKNWDKEKKAKWTLQAIEEMQIKYGIRDEQILSKYEYVLYGFAAELSDKQLYNLCYENIINYIEPNIKFKGF